MHDTCATGMNAIETAIRLMDDKAEWLAEDHTSTAIRNGGFAVWLPEVVLIAVPHDPVGGEHSTTMAVLYCGGDPGRLAEYGTQWAERGFTHVCWCRGFKAGEKSWQKHELGRWARLCRRLNHGR
ncbi:MAG: hypothetical protein IKZ07_05920 [Akkermansia sp.]|nr:hypothetical protein [Akkermansia sp.]